MAFLGYNDLANLIKEKSIIDEADFNPKMLEGASYQLTLGNEVYVTNSKTGKKEILDEKNSQVDINPGQFALLLINEKISIPNNILAFIGLKFSVKAKGLINISGFHVDPGFNGKLVYSVYNAGTRTIVLEKGKPYFSIWFSELKGKTTIDDKAYNGEHQGQNGIRSEDIESLKGELWNPIEMSNRLHDFNSNLTNKITELQGKKEKYFWAFTIAITLLLAVNLKLYLDWSSYKKGYLDGMNEIKAKQRIESVIDSMQIENSIKHRTDSLVMNYCDSINSHQ